MGYGQKRFQNTSLDNASLYGVLTVHRDSFSNTARCSLPFTSDIQGSGHSKHASCCFLNSKSRVVSNSQTPEPTQYEAPACGLCTKTEFFRAAPVPWVLPRCLTGGKEELTGLTYITRSITAHPALQFLLASRPLLVSWEFMSSRWMVNFRRWACLYPWGLAHSSPLRT